MFQLLKKIICGRGPNKEGQSSPFDVTRIDRPVFIVGCGRSGTTILFNLMKDHAELINTEGYPDGEDHVGWIEHGDCIISGLGSLPTINGGHTGYHYCLHMTEKDVTPDIVRRMTIFYNNDVLKGQSKKRIVNKCPHLSNKLRYVRAIFPDAKFVHIVRDCLPVVSSWIKIMENDQPNQVLYWPDTEFPCFWVFPAPGNRPREQMFENEDRIFPGKGIARLVDYWNEVNKNISLQLFDTPELLHTVKYEDLCSDPVNVLNSICDFCEISHFSEVPLTVYKDYNEKYKAHLTDEQQKQFLERAKETRSIFGYL